MVYHDDLVKVEAFRVRHGAWPNVFGYRFTTPDKVIVILGDTALDKKVEQYATGANILIHEVFSEAGVANRTPCWQTYHRENHTSSYELSELASRAKTGLLILYHLLFFGADEVSMLNEVRQKYDREVILANVLYVFE